MADTATTQSDPLFPTHGNLDLFEHTPLKKSRTWFTPDVVLLTGPKGERYVLKDFSKRPGLARHTWCRSAVARETAAYKRLESVAGVPRLVEMLSPDSFIMEFVEGTSLPRRKSAAMIPPAFFDELAGMIMKMHNCGVVHGDLRRKNMLIGTNGKPCIIDFETALIDGRNPVRHRVFNTVAQIDQITALKIKARYFPSELTSGEKHILHDVPLHLRIGRFLRKNVYGLVSPKQIRRRARKKHAANR
ncbi:MAG: RIO1 family regulatory kinase/ATPase [Candidatus Sumerlaeaceae bacterium]